jgi:mRNA-degrading endonuclease YafQ of YafQ-DinJ toxin-antitoxin module
MYAIDFASTFSPTHKKVIKGDKKLEKRLEKTLLLLKNDPFYPSLKSHKVDTRNFGKKWSSRITGDLRIIWDFYPEEKLIIILFAITSHTGKHREYK